MISLTYQSRILLARQTMDFRKGIDGICGHCRNVLGSNPTSGSFFVFINRAKTMVRVLHYDGTGFWLMTKRLSQGRFPWWPNDPALPLAAVEAKELVTLLRGKKPELTALEPAWKKISSTGVATQK